MFRHQQPKELLQKCPHLSSTNSTSNTTKTTSDIHVFPIQTAYPVSLLRKSRNKSPEQATPHTFKECIKTLVTPDKYCNNGMQHSDDDGLHDLTTKLKATWRFPRSVVYCDYIGYTASSPLEMCAVGGFVRRAARLNVWRFTTFPVCLDRPDRRENVRSESRMVSSTYNEHCEVLFIHKCSCVYQ